MMGGDVCIAESEPDKGSTFRITIATKLTDEVRAENRSLYHVSTDGKDNGPHREKSLAEKNILLVEDSADNQLREKNYEKPINLHELVDKVVFYSSYARKNEGGKGL